MGKTTQQYLITGASGQLGRELNAQFDDEETLVKPREMLDVTNHAQVQKAVKSLNPDVVIHCAALTDANEAQKDPDLAWRVNAAATDNMVKTCAVAGVPLIHISSHNVFGRDRTRTTPLKETDPVGPVNWLGVSNAAAEQSVLGLGQCIQPEYWDGSFRYWVLRTSEVFGRALRPSNCMAHHIMRRFDSMTKKQTVNLIGDSIRSFTFAPHLAKSIVWLARNRLEVVSGVYHVANAGHGSPYDFGTRLSRGSQKSCSVSSLPTEKILVGTALTAKTTSRYTAFNLEKWHEIAPFKMPHWHDAAEEFASEWGS